MSQLGILTLDLQLKADEVGVECAVNWLQNNNSFTCLHLCLVLEMVRKCRLTGPHKEHSCVSRGAVGTRLEIFGLAHYLLFINLFGISSMGGKLVERTSEEVVIKWNIQ